MVCRNIYIHKNIPRIYGRMLCSRYTYLQTRSTSLVGLLSKKRQTGFLSHFKTLPSAHEIQRSAFDFMFWVTFWPNLNLAHPYASKWSTKQNKYRFWDIKLWTIFVLIDTFSNSLSCLLHFKAMGGKDSIVCQSSRKAQVWSVQSPFNLGFIQLSIILTTILR